MATGTRKNALTPVDVDVPIEKNMMILKFGYGNEFVMTVTNAAIVLKAMEEAYQYSSNYGKQPTIHPISGDVETKILSAEAYKLARRNHLLGVNDVPDTD